MKALLYASVGQSTSVVRLCSFSQQAGSQQNEELSACSQTRSGLSRNRGSAARSSTAQKVHRLQRAVSAAPPSLEAPRPAVPITHSQLRGAERRPRALTVPGLHPAQVAGALLRGPVAHVALGGKTCPVRAGPACSLESPAVGIPPRSCLVSPLCSNRRGCASLSTRRVLARPRPLVPRVTPGSAQRDGEQGQVAFSLLRPQQLSCP